MLQIEFYRDHRPKGRDARLVAPKHVSGGGHRALRLSAIFLARVPGDRRAMFVAAADLEEILAGLVRVGRAAWPLIPLDDEVFAAFLGGVLGAEAAPDLAAICARDLYLACAYSMGAPGAVAAVDRCCMSRVEKTLTRLGTPAPMREDIQQDLRERLLKMRSPNPDRKGYSGRGALASWLCVTAVREARRMRERSGKDQPLELADPILLCAAQEEPEMVYLHTVYKHELKDALRAAFAELSTQARDVLRYHFIDGLSIDHLGAQYGVHRATAARWINRACDALRRRTRELFARKVTLSYEDFQRMLYLIESEIGAELTGIPA